MSSGYSASAAQCSSSTAPVIRRSTARIRCISSTTVPRSTGLTRTSCEAPTTTTSSSTTQRGTSKRLALSWRRSARRPRGGRRRGQGSARQISAMGGTVKSLSVWAAQRRQIRQASSLFRPTSETALFLLTNAEALRSHPCDCRPRRCSPAVQEGSSARALSSLSWALSSLSWACVFLVLGPAAFAEAPIPPVTARPSALDLLRGASERGATPFEPRMFRSCPEQRRCAGPLSTRRRARARAVSASAVRVPERALRARRRERV
mmetsp:Transcript_36461/g.85189  ORF Transcript_36461/g.85189 Transcript_36461/m.85189 type:complete len:263 (-) Transcript_36461:638-1426(-)